MSMSGGGPSRSAGTARPQSLVTDASSVTGRPARPIHSAGQPTDWAKRRPPPGYTRRPLSAMDLDQQDPRVEHGTGEAQDQRGDQPWPRTFDVLPAVIGRDSSSAAHATLRWVPASRSGRQTANPSLNARACAARVP